MEKFLKFLFIFSLFTSNVLYAADSRKIPVVQTYTEKAEVIEDFLKKNASTIGVMHFTKVPRGLIVSVDRKYLFNECSTKIKVSALPILNDIWLALKHNEDSRCVVEGHTDNSNFNCTGYEYEWEMSLMQAGNIVKYFIDYGKIAPMRLFTLGYGEYMPSVDNFDDNIKLDNRIDFVFIDYSKNTRQ